MKTNNNIFASLLLTALCCSQAAQAQDSGAHQVNAAMDRQATAIAQHSVATTRGITDGITLERNEALVREMNTASREKLDARFDNSGLANLPTPTVDTTVSTAPVQEENGVVTLTAR